MAQKTTYSVHAETEYDRRTKAERARERGRIAEAERQATLRAAGLASLGKVATDVALAKEQNVAPPDPAKLAEEAEQRRVQRQADEARLAELVKKHKHEIALFYRRMESALEGVEKDKSYADEARMISARLGISNPVSTTVMQVGDGVGFTADRALFVEQLLTRFVERYRLSGGQVIPDAFEGARTKKN